jgi:hypothetical protein
MILNKSLVENKILYQDSLVENKMLDLSPIVENKIQSGSPTTHLTHSVKQNHSK